MKKGISLIVLVISIIVMIIIAAAIIITLTSDGIINKAGNAKETYNSEMVKEAASTAYKEWLLMNYSNLDNFTDADVTQYVKQKLKDEGIDTKGFNISVNKDGKITITDNEGNVSELDSVARYGGDWTVEKTNFTNEYDKGIDYRGIEIWTITKYTGNKTDITLPTIYVDDKGEEHEIEAVADYVFSPISEQGILWLKENLYLDDGPNQVAMDYLERNNIDIEEKNAEAQFFACFIRDFSLPIAKVTKITIPSNIKYIGDQDVGDFEDASHLREMVFPTTLDNIVTMGGLDSLPLNKVVFMGGTITSNFVSDTIQTVEICEGVTSIADNAFSNCENLTNVTIPNTVTSMGNGVFNNCENLTNVTLSNNMTTIGSHMFSGCHKLTNMEIPNSVTTIGEYAFNSSEITNIVIPGSVTNIGNNSFAGSNITNITLTNGITTIGDSAFNNCAKLASISIPNSVTTIGQFAFAHSGLTTITIPNSVTSIGNSAFESCTSLTSITINGYNKTQYDIQIPPAMCRNCTSLTNITIANTIECIESAAFAGCTSLVKVSLPNSITMVDIGIFEGCTNLTTFDLDKTQSKLTSLHVSTFSGCSKLKNVTIPNSLSDLGVQTFENCISLTSLTIPTNVKYIQGNTFSNCTNLTVTIPWKEGHLPTSYSSSWNSGITVIYGTEYYRDK